MFGEGALEGEDAYCYWLGGGVHGAICRLDCWLQQGTDDDLGRGEERERDGGLIFFCGYGGPGRMSVFVREIQIVRSY